VSWARIISRQQQKRRPEQVFGQKQIMAVDTEGIFMQIPKEKG
jgi:hypothetical protein